MNELSRQISTSGRFSLMRVPERRRGWLRSLTVLTILMFAIMNTQVGAETVSKNQWRSMLHDQLPTLGHRNWIVVADSAYPAQQSPGIKTIFTDADQEEVLAGVLAEIKLSRHVRPEILLDQELFYVPESDAPGADAVRSLFKKVLAGNSPTQLPHAELIAKLKEVGDNFSVLLLKTRSTVPYSSVFIQLNCAYWSDDAEKRLRAKMQK